MKQWGTNDTVHPEDLPHVIQAFTESIGSGRPYEIVQRLRRSDGVYRWFQNNGFPLREAGGPIVRWCVLLTDIDERKRAEDALRESERESAPDRATASPGLIAGLTPGGASRTCVNRPIPEAFRTSAKRWRSSSAGGPAARSHPEDLPRVVRALPPFDARPGGPFEFDMAFRIITSAGERGICRRSAHVMERNRGSSAVHRRHRH